MKDFLRIAIIGDFDPVSPSHRATNDALAKAADDLSLRVDYRWVSSESLARSDSADILNRFHGLWAAPGAPYQNMDGALEAIRWAREQSWPFVAT
jgi:CTP synthase (UTP-ammonia lyase)